MKIIPLVIICFLINTNAFGQKVDYLDIQDSLTTLTCGKQDRELVNRTALKLEAFDTNVLSKNIQQYYYDLGFAYYVQYVFTNDTNLLRKSIKTYEKALFHKPRFSAALWNLANGYSFLNNCPKTMYYLNRFKKVTHKWRRDEESVKFIRYIEKKCG